jgi:hypothetical protein
LADSLLLIKDPGAFARAWKVRALCVKPPLGDYVWIRDVQRWLGDIELTAANVREEISGSLSPTSRRYAAR